VLARVVAGVAGLSAERRTSVASFRWRAAALAFGVLLVVGGSVGAARGSLRAWAARHGLGFGGEKPDVTSSPRSRASRADARPWLAAEPPVAPGATPTPEPAFAAAATPTPAPPFAAAVTPAPPFAAAVTSTPEPPVAAATRPSLIASTAPKLGAALVPKGAASPPSTTGSERAVPIVPAATAPPAAVESPLAAESPAAEEARLLEGVFHALRSETNAADRALAMLDEHDRRFPAGLMRAEAALARVEALLALGRRAEALALLDAAGALPRGSRVARGELRAEAGRCGEAIADFDGVLATSSGDERGARALYGLASCALRAGDEDGATAALRRYLDGHPDGARAVEARAALAKLLARRPAP
jgi:hypothetical protein